MGYSLGSVVISAYLNSHTPPSGVKFVLLARTSNPNGLFAGTGLLCYSVAASLPTPQPW